MVLHESYPHHWRHRQRRPPGSRSIAGHGRASPRARPQPPHGWFAAARRSGARRSHSPRVPRSMPGWRRYGVPGVGCPAGRRCSRSPADPEAARGASYSSPSPHKTAHPFFQGGRPNPVLALRTEIERLIETSGRQWTFLRPGMFATNALHWWAPRIRAGSDVVRWPYAAAPTAPIHERDIAAVAVRALCEDGHAGAEYVLTGPQSLTQFEQISTIGDVIGRSLRMEEISPEDAKHELLTSDASLRREYAARCLGRGNRSTCARDIHRRRDRRSARANVPRLGRPITPRPFSHSPAEFSTSLRSSPARSGPRPLESNSRQNRQNLLSAVSAVSVSPRLRVKMTSPQ